MQNILFQWLSWHFLEAPGKILAGWRNFFLFNLNYFSVLPLFKNLFAPWRRYTWVYPKGFQITKKLEVWSSNLISRSLGAIMRFSLIAIALFIEVLIVAAGFVILITWFLVPAIFIFGLGLGINLLF